jgi:hypothetical protein
VIVFLGQVVDVFIDIGTLLVLEEVETFTEYGAAVVDETKELEETFFRQDRDSNRTLRAPTED